MVNARLRYHAILGLALAFLLPAHGCSGKKVKDSHRLGFESANESSDVDELWTQKLPGLVTDVSLAGDGNSVLVSTVPDPEDENSPRRFQVSLLSVKKDGDPLWQITVPHATRGQAISDDGTLAVISNHNEEIIGIDGNGQVIWTQQGTCRPVLLSRLKRVLCYHDDDAEADAAFDVRDWSGKKLLSFPITNDVLSLKVAKDETSVVLGLTRGSVILVGPAFRTLWQKKVGGEVLDVAVSGGVDPVVAAIFLSKTKGQRVAIFDRVGKLIAEGSPSHHADQVELDHEGKRVLLFGNSSRGQALSALAWEGNVLTEKWKRAETRHADYTVPMIVGPTRILAGMEAMSSDERYSHLMGFDLDGKLSWDIPIVTVEGAYLYAQAYSAERSVLITGTDQGMLSAYQVSK